MSLERHIRSGSHGRIWIQDGLACVALFAVLAARNVPPDFFKSPCIHSAISDDSHHDQRPRFDDSGSKWKAPADTFRLLPPTAESAPAKVIAHLALSGAAPRQMFLQQAGRVTMFVSPGLTVNMTGHDGGGVNRVARKEQRHG